MTTNPLAFFLPLAVRKPFAVFLLLFGGTALLASAVSEVVALRALLSFPSHPRTAPLESSPPGSWVELTGTLIECDSRRQIGEHTYFLGRSFAGRRFIASYNRPTSCEAARGHQLGVLQPLDPRLASTLARNGVPLPPGRLDHLCTSCGPGNARLGAWLLLAGMLVGGFLVWVGLREHRRLRGSAPMAEAASGET